MTITDDPAVPFEKITLAEPSDDVPAVGRVANGGGTITLALVGWQKDKADELIAKGYRPIRRWRVETGRVITELPLEDYLCEMPSIPEKEES